MRQTDLALTYCAGDPEARVVLLMRKEELSTTLDALKKNLRAMFGNVRFCVVVFLLVRRSCVRFRFLCVFSLFVFLRWRWVLLIFLYLGGAG